MTILLSVFGLLFISLSIVSFLCITDTRKSINKIKELCDRPSILSEANIRTELKGLGSNKSMLTVTAVIGLCFVVFLTLYIYDHKDKYERKPYKSVEYSLDNNVITQKTLQCYKMKWDSDNCEVVSTETKSIKEIFGDE